MYSIVIPTYCNPEYLKLCVDSILENSYYNTHQLCIHVNGYDQKTIDYLNSKNISFTLSQENIGLPKATNILLPLTKYNKILSANDDLYFSKNWDYYLHQWEIELDNKFPDYIKIIGYRFCEPFPGSFQPICDAGETIHEFDINKLNEYIKKYSIHDVQGEWLSNALYPRDVLLSCKPSEDFKSKIVDMDVILKILKYLKDRYNDKFLIFRVKDVNVYHFGSIVTKRLSLQTPEHNEVPQFENKWGMTIDAAFNKVLKNEVDRSIRIYKEYKNNDDNMNEINNYKNNDDNMNEINNNKNNDDNMNEINNNKKPKSKISTYISTVNALFYQTTLEQTIRQSLLFSDEIIVVNSQDSSDDTQNLLDNLKSEYPNIIKLYTFKEDFDNPNHKMRWDTVAEKKTFALRKCTGDYCILQDDDEMIHEKYAEYIKLLPKICPDTVAFRFNVVHFYRSYNHYQNGNNWYPRKIYMCKNIPEIKHGLVGTDPDNYVTSLSINNMIQTVPLDSLESPKVINTAVTVHHYGWANRNDAILLYKKYMQEIQWWGKDYWKSHEFPFKFDDPNTLLEFKGTHPKHMIPIIEKESKYNSKWIKDFTK